MFYKKRVGTSVEMIKIDNGSILTGNDGIFVIGPKVNANMIAATVCAGSKKPPSNVSPILFVNPLKRDFSTFGMRCHDRPEASSNRHWCKWNRSAFRNR